MNAVIEDPNKNVTELRAPGPGERLRSARVSAGLEISTIAAQLHLGDAMVHALERDDYQAMPGRVFVRGYLRNYARLVGVPDESVLKQFDEQLPDELEDRQLNRIGTSVSREVRSNHSAVRLITWLVLFAVLGAFFAWWKGYLSWLGQSSVVAMVEEEPPIALSAPRTDGQLALPSRPAPPGATPPVPTPQAAPDARPAADRTRVGVQVVAPPMTAADKLLPLPPPAAGRPTAPNVAQSRLRSEVSILTTQTATPVITPASNSSLDAPIAPGIVLQFDGPCWVDVRDAKRKFKLFGEMPKGARRVLGGTPPYDVVLGNASVVRVSINGAPYDITRHARGNVARFVLDPASI